MCQDKHPLPPQSRVKRPAEDDFEQDKPKRSKGQTPAEDSSNTLANGKTLSVQESSASALETPVPKFGALLFPLKTDSSPSSSSSSAILPTTLGSASPLSKLNPLASTSKPVFGATTAFNKSSNNNNNNINAHNQSPLVEKSHPVTSTDLETQSLKQPASTLQFGVGSRFSSAFKKVTEKPSFLDKSPDKQDAAASEALEKPLHSAFGSGSRFGSAFQTSLKKKSCFETTSNNSTSNNNDRQSCSVVSTESQKSAQLGSHDGVKNKSFLDETTNSSHSKTPEKVKNINLAPAKPVTTGEENEDLLYSAYVRLFELDLTNVSEGWKERGKGALHFNQERNAKSQVRLVMRAQGLLRVVLNYKVTHKTEFLKGFDASLAPEKFMRFNSLSLDGKPIQYLLKFKSQDDRDKLELIIRDTLVSLDTAK